jgi:hypothetical protein
VLLDRLLVQRVDDRDLGLPAGRGDLGGDRLEAFPVRPVRNTRAPSLAMALAVAPPMCPPPP